jgi:hypothetical protein
MAEREWRPTRRRRSISGAALALALAVLATAWSVAAGGPVLWTLLCALCVIGSVVWVVVSVVGRRFR